MPSFLLNGLLVPKRVKKNLRNPFPTYLILNLVSIVDLMREKVAKPFYRSLPVDFKVWYDKIRYRV
ncbi:MAG: hypothetical protein AABX99_02945, partial [Nanoarchaeota archaeon]